MPITDIHLIDRTCEYNEFFENHKDKCKTKQNRIDINRVNLLFSRTIILDRLDIFEDMCDIIIIGRIVDINKEIQQKYPNAMVYTFSQFLENIHRGIDIRHVTKVYIIVPISENTLQIIIENIDQRTINQTFVTIYNYNNRYTKFLSKKIIREQ